MKFVELAAHVGPFEKERNPAFIDIKYDAPGFIHLCNEKADINIYVKISELLQKIGEAVEGSE